MSDESDDEDRMYFIEKQKIDLTGIELSGRILDIGGGGEGIIGLFKGKQVIAIDRRKGELEEAPEGEYLKIVMDAKDLKFLDKSFDTVTAFFCFMYVPLENREKIFEEIYRVLKLDGQFVIWDLIIPKKGDNDKELFGAEFEISFEGKKISTGYGTYWNKTQDLVYFIEMGKKKGFNVIEERDESTRVFIRFQK